MTYMKQIYHYYQENITAYTKRIALLSKKIHLLGTIRLVLILLLFINIWIFKSGSAIVLASTSISILLIFAYLMYLHTKLSNEKEYFETLCKLNKDELNGLDYDFRAFEDYDSSEKMKESHPYCLDLDIFGEKSLFQSINRTVTAGGKEYLANSFLHPLNDKNDILERQEAIKELSQAVQWRQHFYATGKTCSKHKMQTVELSKLLHIQPFFSESRMWKLWMLLIPFGWIALGVACLFNLIPTSVFGIYVIIAGAFAYAKSKKVNDLYNTADKTEKILLTYSELIKSIEQQTFQATALQRISNGLFTNKLSASTHIKRLSSLIGGLNQRFSLAGILLNILYLRDTRHALRLEQWVKDHAGDTSAWLNILFEIDAYCSLAGFAFNHPDYIYPTVTDEYFCLRGKGLGHPLLNRNSCVRNNIHIDKAPSFLIITGANMAGKSTYLRTIGTNFLLASMGVPVCAHSFSFYPAKLFTSLRTNDSLVNNESYFFAELKRLKMIIEQLKSGKQLFIILDEILKGTNSEDKQKGSLALLKQLISLNSCGIIATHDLVLGSLEQEFPNEVKNFRFEADIKDNELTFSYQLQEGIAKNMNACFLMKKMGITI